MPALANSQSQGGSEDTQGISVVHIRACEWNTHDVIYTMTFTCNAAQTQLNRLHTLPAWLVFNVVVAVVLVAVAVLSCTVAFTIV